MAISKRTRFEVLKRDNHTCRYCGEAAPNVALHVDRVIPVSLGGTDKPDNLVAACKDCNLGKSSTNPSDKIINDVNEQALAYSQALRDNIKKITGTARGLRRTRVELETYWEALSDEYGYSDPAPMDQNWGPTLRKWLALGVEEDFLKDAMDIAFAKYGVSRADRFRYFCGVIYRTLDEAHEETQGRAEASPKECGHCFYCRYPEHRDEGDECAVYYTAYPGDDNPACSICGTIGCLYELGIQDGMEYEWRQNYDAIIHYRDCGKVAR